MKEEKIGFVSNYFSKISEKAWGRSQVLKFWIAGQTESITV